jgi:heme exporter protein B
MNSLRQIWAILHKDLLLELRSKEIITSMLVFALIVIAVFNFIFDPGSELIRTTAPGILWVAIIFASNLGLSRSFSREHENAMMQGILLCPIDRSLIYIAKVIGNVIFISIVQLVSLPIMVVLFDLKIGNALLPLLLVLFLGTLGFAGIGTIFSTMSANTKSREVMLPILLFPVAIPIILAATKSTSYLLAGRDFAEVWSWMRILIGFDIVFLVICFILYEFVLEE